MTLRGLPTEDMFGGDNRNVSSGAMEFMLRWNAQFRPGSKPHRGNNERIE